MTNEKLYWALRKLAHGAAIVAGYAALGLSLLIVFEVIARKLFSFSLQGVDEIGGYVLAIGVAFSFAYALVHRAHTRVDMLLVKFPVPLRAFLNTLAMLLLTAFSVFMLWRAIETLRETLEFDSHASTPLQTPLWIPQSLWVVGLGVFAVLTALLAARAVILLLRGRLTEVNSEFGPRSADDELEEARQDYSSNTPKTQQRSSAQ